MTDVLAALSLLRQAAFVSARLDASLREHGLTADRWRALAAVEANPGSSMADLIDALVIPPTSATRAIDSLVESGAVYRSPAPYDRRRVTLQISAQGALLLREVEPIISLVYEESAVSSVRGSQG